jgi:hypothetical protein
VPNRKTLRPGGKVPPWGSQVASDRFGVTAKQRLGGSAGVTVAARGTFEQMHESDGESTMPF